MLRRRLTALIPTAALVLGLAAPAAAEGPRNPHCGRQDRLQVPGAQVQKTACLDDLTTAGTATTGHTVPADYAGLHAPGTVNPTGVPGVQIDGYFPDDSTSNKNNGWNHDSQFVIRLPDNWNGGIVITGAPGARSQYANDFIIADTVLAKGYAFASTDKGNMGPTFFEDGRKPGDAVAEWNERVTQLTKATKKVAKQRYRSSPTRTLLFGISNGGYLVRWQLENRPELYDGGLDWEGTLFSRENNLIGYLPTALKNYPAYAKGDEAAHQAMLDAGFEPGTEYLWAFHYQYYWDFTQRAFREEFDPSWDGDLNAGIPFCSSGTPNCDADYDVTTRPKALRAIDRVALTGKIKKPLITLHGTHDTLLPISIDSDVYEQMIADHGRDRLHRYYRYEGGTHVDSLYPAYPTTIRPLLPCARTGFEALETWVGKGRKRGQAPPPDATVPKPTGGDQLNSCSLS